MSNRSISRLTSVALRGSLYHGAQLRLKVAAPALGVRDRPPSTRESSSRLSYDQKARRGHSQRTQVFYPLQCAYRWVSFRCPYPLWAAQGTFYTDVSEPAVETH